MTEYYFMDGKYVPAEEAVIPVRTHAFLYGTSVFEGIRAYFNQEENQLYIFRMKEHFERMLNSAKIMYMDAQYTVDEYMQITKDMLNKNGYRSDTYIRPEVYKSALKIGPGLIDNKDSVLIFSFGLGDYCDTSKGLHVCCSSWDRVEDNMIPPRAKIAGSYANTALIITEAKKSGFDDAIVLSRNGHVAEGSAMNLFLLEGNTLVTTPTTSNILVGVTRNTILEIAKDLGLEVEEREINRTELYIADGAFFCGTGAQVAPITKIDHRELNGGVVADKILELQKYYFDIVRGKVEKYKKWCTPVYD
ncbi:MAG: branched-chain amino acid transaminase [Cyanobacteria bacterium SIG30]|nr:branched-chain amino acid transaminase [Cyanobacteria bacterium SIG30]